MKTITLTIKRSEEKTETVDVTEKFGKLDQNLFNQIKKATLSAGKGEVLNAKIIERKSNIKELITAYNNTMNEGAEGYLPPEEYFTSKPEFKTWNDTKIIK